MDYDLEKLGAGIGLRRSHFQDIVTTERTLDWLEFTPENYMSYGGRARLVLEQCAERWPMVAHGVALNLGGVAPLNDDYLRRLRNICDLVNARWFSDHLCWTGVDNLMLHELLPMPLTREAVDHLVGRIREVRSYIDRPMLIENISFYAVMPGAEMSEPQFIGEILEKADCGLLLDINNVFVNSHNHGFDPVAYVDQLPLERVVQLHMAGHDASASVWIDTHGAPVRDEVWALYEYTISKIGYSSVLLERDNNIPSLDEVLDEADQCRKVLDKYHATP